MNKNILIIHYNTPYLTECLVRSINLFVSDAKIYILDNSDERPFKAKFDNLVLLDNTKGQLIDFEKFLGGYKTKRLSSGMSNKWASAKHCYSVERCMDIIGENFILLDSDVLLKRDISDLFKNDVLYVGESAPQYNPQIKRILPFLCYINVDMCKKNGVHYFNDKYMHGLRKTTSGDKYDTGAWFYLATREYPKFEIKCNEYIVHYGHGSWDAGRRNSPYSYIEWARKYKQYWDTSDKKKVVYTCITGNYDRLIDPKYITPDFDYVCFTDNADFRSDIWDIRPMPKECDGLTQVKRQRYVKINPHLLLSDYDISIWVDGNVSLKGDLDKLLDEVLRDDCSVYVPKHPQRNCIYMEERAVKRMKKDSSSITKKQIDRYRSEGFPKNYGLLQSNILIRKHNNDDCIRLMEEWFKEVKDGSHRDQLSFNYVLWKNSDIKVIYLNKYIYRSEYFFWNGYHSKMKHLPNKVDKKISSIEKKAYEFDLPKTIEALKNEFQSLLERGRKIRTSDIPLY